MGDGDGAERLESHLVAALGIKWAHAVTIRLVFESHSGLYAYLYHYSTYFYLNHVVYDC